MFVLIEVSHAEAQISSTRKYDPVILTGSQLSGLINLNPNQIIGFKFLNDDWTQIPIQIDERELLDISSPYGAQAGVYNNTYPLSPSNPKVLYYSDSTTAIGSDTNSLFDNDDELIFMASDTGEKALTNPTGGLLGTCQEVQIKDPLNTDIAYIYLCQNISVFSQDAGIDYVNYVSDLNTTVGFPYNENVENIEDTTISTSEYSWHFISEWKSDEFKIAGGTLDILDRQKVLGDVNGTPNCNLSTHGFSSNGNAFATVKDGPIRVIRSYIGANSGVNTQRTHFFYKGRHDMVNDLHVHPFAVDTTLYDVYDYSPAAIGMTYLNDQQPSTASRVTIDGVDDVLVQNAQALLWEEVRGPNDVVSIIHKTETDATSAEVSFVPYYQDNSGAPEFNCLSTGDGQALSTSGMGSLIKPTVCTDILHGNCDASEFRTIKNERITYIDQGATIADNITAQYRAKIDNPLNVSISSYEIKNKRGGSKRISKERLTDIFGTKNIEAEDLKNIQCSIDYTRLITFGVRGEDVKQVQACMNSLGYTSGPEDGIYGPLTYAGIIAYQQAQDLKVDGIVGPNTSNSLNTLVN